MNDHRLHRSPCSTDSSRKPGWSPTILSKADTGVMRSATSSFQTGMTVCSFACSMNCSSDDCILKVKSCRSLIESFSGYGMNISFTKNYVIISSNFDFIPIFWVKQNLVTDFHCLTFGPVAFTSAQANLRDTCAVAGIRIPPDERRSPSSPGISTSILSLSIFTGRRSDGVGTAEFPFFVMKRFSFTLWCL